MSQQIFARAPLHMRYSRESYFEPKFVSTGPYFYQKLKERKAIRKAKEECISFFASKLETGSSNPNINHLVREINVAEMKVQIDQWYGKNFGLQEDDFFRMLVRDSCFIIRIILAFSREGEESMFYPGVDIKTVRIDLLLLENQIPFFFLEKVYNFFRDNDMLPSVTPLEYSQSSLSLVESHSHLSHSTLSPEESKSHTPEQSTVFIDIEFLAELKPFICLDMPWQFDEQAMPIDPKHLLDIYWKWCIPPSLLNGEGSNPADLLYRYKVHASWGKIHLRSNAHKRIKNARELYKRAGINFQKREHKDGFGVTFRHGILQMPHLHLDPNYTTLIANLIAFEDFKPSNKRFLTSYVLLLDGLINTEKDVELLERYGLITNKLRSSQMASTYFNDIGNVCSVDYDNHYCKNQFDDLNTYYNSIWHRQLANLGHEYFNSPWAVISFMAGLTLLILSAIQTHYTIASYHQNR